MAGERSKAIGEIGENIAENFFDMIGWKSPQKGVYYPCLYGPDHALEKSINGIKEQHGIDFQYSYKSSLESDTVNNLLVSVKHHKDEGYPGSATKKVKGFVKDLIDSLVCFTRSKERQEVVSSYQGVKSINDIPVLFYLSSKDDERKDFVNKLQSSRFINDYDVKEFYIIDNKRVTFIINALNFVNNNFDECDWFFFYPVTGLNVSDTNSLRHGSKMQIEFLNSGFIPFILKKKVGGHKTSKFVVVSDDEFSEDNFSRFVTYARTNCSDTISDIEIVIRGYYPDDHDPIVRKVISLCDEELDISVSNYDSSFRGLNNG